MTETETLSDYRFHGGPRHGDVATLDVAADQQYVEIDGNRYCVRRHDRTLLHSPPDQTAANLNREWSRYRAACYGDRQLPADQEREVHQAFLSGMVALLTIQTPPTLELLRAELESIGAFPTEGRRG